MWLTKVSILRPVTIMMFVAALIVLGWQSVSRMPVELYPKIDVPYISVVTAYPGAGPEEIETLVTKPLEEGVSGVSGVKNVTSASQEGVSSVAIEFYVGTNLDIASNDVRAKVDTVRQALPEDAMDPVIVKADVSAVPVISMGLSSPRPASEVRDIADDLIKDRLARVPGVASVAVAGGDVREILVAVNKARLDAYGISISQLNSALQAENLNLPSGTVTEGRREYAVRMVGEFGSVAELRELKVPTPSGPVRLGDLAAVADTVAERSSMTRLDRQDSVTITVQKQSDANTVGVADGVKRQLEALTGKSYLERGWLDRAFGSRPPAKGLLPPDIAIKIGFDQAPFVTDTITEVRNSLFLGVLLVMGVVFLFLHSIRGTFIVGLAIPTSLMATLTPIFFANFTMNMMVMLALSLVVGILVDDSIVVLENIYRHLRLGEEPREAALNGRTEIGLAAITITLVDVVVFVPIAFMGGMVGQFFRQFGITVATATLFSLFISFTLTPMLASRWFRRRKVEDYGAELPTLEQADLLPADGGRMGPAGRLFARFDRFYDRLDRGYRRVLGWALHHRWQVVVIGFGSLLSVVPLILLGVLGGEFFPEVDQGRFEVGIETPAGTSLEQTNQLAAQVETILWDRRRFPEVETLFTTVGSTASGLMGSMGGGGGMGATYSQVMVVLVDKTERKRTVWQVMDALRPLVAEIPGASIKARMEGGMGPPGQARMTMEITGGDMRELSAVAERVADTVRQVPGTINVDTSWRVGRPELQARVDRLRAADYGLSVGQIAAALRTSVEGSTDTKYREGGKEYDIRVRLNKPDREHLGEVPRLIVGTRAGRAVHLDEVAQIAMSTGPTKIDRKNRQRMVTVGADLESGANFSKTEAAIKKAVANVPLDNASLAFGGESVAQAESFGQMFSALFLSVALVFMLMAALFESLLSPLVIMFSLPMAMVGAVLALLVTGHTMNVISMIGIIMLMGLVTKNAILLVDYTNTLRQRGIERNPAILEAGPTRLRPILMTTFAMIGGMLPTALALGRGSEIRAPLAIAVIGGLILSTLLTLVVIPVLYTLFDDVARRFGWKVGQVQTEG